jgi:hypothetical protein
LCGEAVLQRAFVRKNGPVNAKDASGIYWPFGFAMEVCFSLLLSLIFVVSSKAQEIGEFRCSLVTSYGHVEDIVEQTKLSAEDRFLVQHHLPRSFMQVTKLWREKFGI